MKRIALGVWRWAGATSPGSRYCTATEIVWPDVRSGTPGLSNRRIRRSAPRPGAMNSGVRRTSGSISRQRQTRACMAEALGRMSGPGCSQGASSPAADSVETKSVRAMVAAVVRMLMAGSVLPGSRVRDPRPVLRQRSRVDAQVQPGDHLGVVGGEEHRGLRVVPGAGQAIHREHLLEVERTAARLRPGPTPAGRAREAFLDVGPRRRQAVD